MGPFRLSTYFPAGFDWKPLKMFAKNTFVENERSNRIGLLLYLILVKWNSDNPIKLTSLNFNSILTGLSAPCLIDILGMWSGSIGIKLMPLCPSLTSISCGIVEKWDLKKKKNNMKNWRWYNVGWVYLLTFAIWFNHWVRYTRYTINVTNSTTLDVLC